MQDWNARYINHDTPWDRGAPSPALFTWLESFQPGRVIVPGCGAGHDVVELAARGFEVTAVDLAPVALEVLEKALLARQLTANLVEANVLNWKPSEPVDGVFEQTCFCALDPEHWSQYAEQLYSWIRPAGTLKASFMQTGRDGGPPFDCPLEKMSQFFRVEQWEWPEGDAERIAHRREDIFELSLELVRR